MHEKVLQHSVQAGLVWELLKEEKSASRLTAEHGLHPNQLYRWRHIALNGLPNLFAREGAEGQAAKDAAHEQSLHELDVEIGKLATRLNWLKKSCHVDTQ